MYPSKFGNKVSFSMHITLFNSLDQKTFLLHWAENVAADFFLNVLLLPIMCSTGACHCSLVKTVQANNYMYSCY